MERFSIEYRKYPGNYFSFGFGFGSITLRDCLSSLLVIGKSLLFFSFFMYHTQSVLCIEGKQGSRNILHRIKGHMYRSSKLVVIGKDPP